MFSLPKNVLNAIESMITKFLWNGKSQGHTNYKVSWDICCQPLEEGGLGLKKLEDMNEIAVIKQVWRILAGEETMWTN